MDSIETQLTQLNTIKSDIKAAIVAKGVSGVTDDFKTYASKILSITTGGSSSKSFMQTMIEDGACVVSNESFDPNEQLSYRPLTTADEDDFDWMSESIVIRNGDITCAFTLITWWLAYECLLSEVAGEIEGGSWSDYFTNMSGLSVPITSYFRPSQAKTQVQGYVNMHLITYPEASACTKISDTAKNILGSLYAETTTAVYLVQPYYDKTAGSMFGSYLVGGLGKFAMNVSLRLTATANIPAGMLLVASIPDEWFAK